MRNALEYMSLTLAAVIMLYVVYAWATYEPPSMYERAVTYITE